jgi:NADH:ubiquinone oxidoreductase subunit E
MKVEELNVEEMIGTVGQILSERDRKKAVMIHSLHRIQEEYGFLPEDVLDILSDKLSLPLAEVYSVASFYKQFHFTPRGRKIVRVCTGTACHVRGAKNVLNAVEDEFKVKEGETTEDLELTLETVGCVGCCGLAPVVTINDDVSGDITGAKKLKSLIKSIKEDEHEQETE